MLLVDFAISNNVNKIKTHNQLTGSPMTLVLQRTTSVRNHLVLTNKVRLFLYICLNMKSRVRACKAIFLSTYALRGTYINFSSLGG